MPIDPPLAAGPRPDVLPLSSAQQRLWFLDRLHGQSTEYNQAFAVRLRGGLNVPALTRAFTTIVERHEVLRTRYVEAEGVPAQVIDPPQPVPMALEDLRGLEPARRDAFARASFCREQDTPFDFARDPMLRARLLQIDG